MADKGFEYVWNQVVELGLGQEGYQKHLLVALEMNLAAFALKYRIGGETPGNGYILFDKDGKSYEARQLFIQVTKPVTIAHMKGDVIDTMDLEARMRIIDWNREYNFIPDAATTMTAWQEKELQQQIWSIFQDMNTIMASTNPRLLGIGLLLQRKYWSGTTFGKQIRLIETCSLVNGMQGYKFDLDIIRPTVFEAAHIIMGRPVCKEVATVPLGKERFWCQLVYGQLVDYRDQVLKFYPYKDLRSLLNSHELLKIREDADYFEPFLLRGNMLRLPYQDRSFFSSYDAASHQLFFFDKNRMPVPLKELMAIEQSFFKERTEEFSWKSSPRLLQIRNIEPGTWRKRRS